MGSRTSRRIIFVLLLLAISGLSLCAAPNPNLAISHKFEGSPLAIRTSAQFAGAIYSLTWRGKEFLNSFDHGRELQSAVSYDGYGECFNPTEAGSETDGAGSSSSSRTIRSKAHRKRLDTTIQMAYWLAPGELYRQACGSHSDVREARNQTVLSADTVRKQVRIGIRHLRNVIECDVTLVIADDHQAATIEALTGYMPPEFSVFLAYDSGKRTEISLSDGPGEQSQPIIFTTPDRDYAMGVFSPGAGGPNHPRSSYGRWRFRLPAPGESTVKWNVTYRESPVPRGEYHYRCYLAVGTLDDVKFALARLSK